MRRPRLTLVVVAALPETGLVAPHGPARQAPQALNVDLATRTAFHSGVGAGFLYRVGHDGTVNSWMTVVLAGFDEYKSNGGSSRSFTFTSTSPGSGTYFAPPKPPDYFIDVVGDSARDRAAVRQWPCCYERGEQFCVHGAGTDEVMSPNFGLCIAPLGGPAGVGTPSRQISCFSPTTTWASGHDTSKVANDGSGVDNDRVASNAGAAVDQRMCSARINEGVIPK